MPKLRRFRVVGLNADGVQITWTGYARSMESAEDISGIHRVFSTDLVS